MSQLSPEQRALLKDLERNPVWAGLLRTLASSRKAIPRWKLSDKSEQEKWAEWIFCSGVEHERAEILKLLGYDYGD